MIVAGITLFHPDLERLKENIDSIVSQVDEVVLIMVPIIYLGSKSF